MPCNHDRYKCTNNVFFCLDCGAVLPPDVLQRKPEGQEEKPAEAQKTARKRKSAQK